MRNRSASTVRWIARIGGGLIGLGLAVLFLGYLGSDLYRMASGTPVEADGFFAAGAGAFFAQVLPTLAMIALAIAGLALFWRRESLGIALALAGGLSVWVFSIAMALIRRGVPVSDPAACVRIFAEMLPLPALLTVPALLMLLARRLDRPARKPGA